MGPVFGIKGGAAGGGMSQILPMENINLHFTGDIHAVASATNLLAAMTDNSVFQGNPLNIDQRQILWRRTVDMNDRALRNIIVGLGGVLNGIPREEGFDITAASEVMAILCLAEDLHDLKERLSRILVAYDKTGNPVYAKDLKAEGSMAVLLKDALKPNLVQTLEGTPALVHGGPFANIAHGCNSAVATKMALKLADYVITEAGFGADLGAEKFFNIKCRAGNLKPSAVVIVATIRALKLHGGVPKEQLEKPNLDAVKRGAENLDKHIENISVFGVPSVVALNAFPSDAEKEREWLVKYLSEKGVDVAISEIWEKGGEGGIEMAKAVISAAKKKSDFKLLYDENEEVAKKIEKIVKTIYSADGVKFTKEPKKMLARLNALGLDKLPVCMAKTQYSFSDNPKLLGRPKNFHIQVSRLKPCAGAGFIVAYTGDIMTMPGLSKVPAAEAITVDDDGNIFGLF